MTGRFHTYIYTNCRAEEGLQQRDGFQFQAVSPRADLAALPVIQRRLLYEPSPQWMRERRSVSEYPPSFAHVYDSEMYATAAGVYLGRESSGGREGNQLTHAIATADPRSYGLVRPAQLFGAPFWTSVQAPARQCPPLEQGWQPGPFGVPEAQRFVRTQDRGEALLTALLSHLRGTDRRRVLFVAREPEPVLRWITAATLLIPHREALRIGFKIFTLNPAYADHRILAVHPDWSTGSASVDNQLGYVVFDLVAHDWTPVAPDPAARRWVRLFLTEDPYDVADAVEVAAEVAEGHPELRPADTALALAVVLGRPPEPEAVPRITAWLADCSEEMIERYGAGVTDQLLATASHRTTEDLIELDEALFDSLPQRAARVRLTLLRTEIGELAEGRPVRPGRLPAIAPPAWGPADGAAAADVLAAAMRDAAPADFESLLRLTARFGVAPPQPDLEPGLERFVRYWAQHPELNCRPRDWADGDDIEDKLKTLLARRIGDEPDAADRLADQWCLTLLDRARGLATPLDRLVVSAALRVLDEEARFFFVRDLLQQAREEPDPVGAFVAVAAVLWRREAPTLNEAKRLAGLRPDGAEFGAEHFPALAAGLIASRVEDDHFAAAYVLVVDQKAWKPPPQVMRALSQEGNMRSVITWLGRRAVDAQEIVAMMRQVPPHTLDRHRDRLLHAMVTAKSAAAVLAILRENPDLLPEYVRDLRPRVSDRRWHAAQMTMAFVLHKRPDFVDLAEIDPGTLDELGERVTTFVVRSSDARRAEVDNQVALLGEQWPPVWEAFARQARSRRVISWFLPDN